LGGGPTAQHVCRAHVRLDTHANTQTHAHVRIHTHVAIPCVLVVPCAACRPCHRLWSMSLPFVLVTACRACPCHVCSVVAMLPCLLSVRAARVSSAQVHVHTHTHTCVDAQVHVHTHTHTSPFPASSSFPAPPVVFVTAIRPGHRLSSILRCTHRRVQSLSPPFVLVTAIRPGHRLSCMSLPCVQRCCHAAMLALRPRRGGVAWAAQRGDACSR
jgi:hypothetical protein